MINMDLKQELINLRNTLINNNKKTYNPTEIKLLKNKKKDVTPISLNNKIEKFINSNYTNPKIARNLIEKIAVWYELRYPDYELIKKFNRNTNKTEQDINQEMFVNNPYIKEHYDDINRIKRSEICSLKWDELYNKEVFINTLTDDEYRRLTPIYNDMIYCGFAHLHLSKEGIIEMDELNLPYINLTNMHIKDALALLEQEKTKLPYISFIEKICKSLEKEIKKYEKKEFIKNQILTCAMYKIIERGSKTVGAYRAFLFAKEFGQNIDIPLIYGINSLFYYDNTINFIEEYLSSGGNPDLICYKTYPPIESNGKTTLVLLKDVLEGSLIIKKKTIKAS